MGWWHHSWMVGNAGWEGLLMGGIMMLLFWGGLIALAYVAVRAATGSGSSQNGGVEQALKSLAERYARGEIDAQEYQEKKQALQA